MSYGYDLLCIGVRGLNVKAAAAVAGAAWKMKDDPYFKCSKLDRETMPSFENIYRQCL
jgi:hypothetical protein